MDQCPRPNIGVDAVYGPKAGGAVRYVGGVNLKQVLVNIEGALISTAAGWHASLRAGAGATASIATRTWASRTRAAGEI